MCGRLDGDYEKALSKEWGRRANREKMHADDARERGEVSLGEQPTYLHNIQTRDTLPRGLLCARVISPLFCASKFLRLLQGLTIYSINFVTLL